MRADADQQRGPTEPRAAAQRLVELIRGMMDCRRASIVLLDPETKTLQPLAASGLTPDEEQRWEARMRGIHPDDPRIDPALIARLHTDESLVLDLTELRFLDRRNLGTREALTVPMRVGARLVGFLVVDYGRAPHEYTPDDRTLSGAVAALVALIVERVQQSRPRADTARLDEPDRLRADVIATISHDLRTPITATQASLGMLEASASERLRPDERDLLRNARRGIERVGLRVTDLLTVSQLEAGILRLERRALDLRTVVMSAMPPIHPLLREKGQALDVDLPEPLPTVGDARRLEQVVTNLLVNAHRHTPAGTRIVLFGQVAAGDVLLSVSDNGPGIPPEEREAIFQRFHRLEGAGGGSGLGLAIVRQIVELHGGRVWAESQHEGGATFHVALPRHDMDGEIL